MQTPYWPISNVFCLDTRHNRYSGQSCVHWLVTGLILTWYVLSKWPRIFISNIGVIALQYPGVVIFRPFETIYRLKFRIPAMSPGVLRRLDVVLDFCQLYTS